MQQQPYRLYATLTHTGTHTHMHARNHIQSLYFLNNSVTAILMLILVSGLGRPKLIFAHSSVTIRRLTLTGFSHDHNQCSLKYFKACMCIKFLLCNILSLSVCGLKCKKYVQKHFWKKHLCALQVFLCALVSRPVCIRIDAQLRGNIGRNRAETQTWVAVVTGPKLYGQLRNMQRQ